MGCATSQDEKRQKEVCVFKLHWLYKYFISTLVEANKE